MKRRAPDHIQRARFSQSDANLRSMLGRACIVSFQTSDAVHRRHQLHRQRGMLQLYARLSELRCCLLCLSRISIVTELCIVRAYVNTWANHEWISLSLLQDPLVLEASEYEKLKIMRRYPRSSEVEIERIYDLYRSHLDHQRGLEAYR